MRRADRLFQIIQILRRSTRPVTAAALAEELEVSKRTVYRDMSDLIGQRVPITGEAGLGYVLAPEYDMPPLMLTPDELDAIALGAQWAANLPDRSLANAARDVIAKIASAVPEHLRPYIVQPSSGVKRPTGQQTPVDTTIFRLAIRTGRKLKLRYVSEAGERTERAVSPVAIGYDDPSCLLIAWCDLRGGFRHSVSKGSWTPRSFRIRSACAPARFGSAGCFGGSRSLSGPSHRREFDKTWIAIRLSRHKTSGPRLGHCRSI